MALKITSNNLSRNFLNDLTSAKNEIAKVQKEIVTGEKEKASFYDHLSDGLKSVNAAQVDADKMSTAVATGKSTNIQEAMMSMAQAQLSFNLMVQVRNKALEAYQEVMRMPV